MTALRATFHFRVFGLIVDEALLGREFTFEDEQRRLVIGLPVRDQGSEDMTRDPEATSLPPDLFTEEAEAPMVERAGYAIGRVYAGPVVGAGRIQIVRARVYYEGTPSAAGYDEGAEAPDSDASFEELRDAGEAAQALVELLVDHVRIETNQYWLGLQGAAPVQVGRSELVDVDACRQLPLYVTIGPSPIIRMGRGRAALKEPVLDAVVDAVRRGDRPTLARQLLADSAFYLEEAIPADYPRAVITAAIACEVRIKEFLREHAGSEESRGLVDILLARPRDFSVALLALFDRPAKVVAGRSLREENKTLYNQVDKLIQTRNAIAHRGEFPSEHVATECVRAGFGAFRWMHAK